MSFFAELVALVQRWMTASMALVQVARPPLAPPRAGYYAACMVRAEQVYRVPWVRVAAIIQHESQWREKLVSPTNDWGLGQHHCPSFFCSRHPTDAARTALLDPCLNIQLTAAELSRERKACRRRHCGNYVKLYNPGNPHYAVHIARWEAKLRQAVRGPRPVRVAWER